MKTSTAKLTFITLLGIGLASELQADASPAKSHVVTVDAKPEPIAIDPTKTAVIVVDMQNDFGAKGGMFDRAGIDISAIREAIGPTAKVLAAARAAGVKIIYLKMAFKPDLSDLGAPDSPSARSAKRLGFGDSIRAPDGSEGRILIRDTWNTDILPELKPQPDDVVIYKHRYSGFYQTELDATLKKLGIKDLIITGCTTSICVEATVRDAMYRDYRCVALTDCMNQPKLGKSLPGSNHDASLVLIESSFGWVSSSNQFINALQRQPVAAQ